MYSGYPYITKDINICYADMRIVPVGSSGNICGFSWFLKMTREITLFGDTFYHNFNLLDCDIEAKSLWQPQIEAPYLKKNHGDTLVCLASHIIIPK
jgi:hypothetical protein